MGGKVCFKTNEVGKERQSTLFAGLGEVLCLLYTRCRTDLKDWKDWK